MRLPDQRDLDPAIGTGRHRQQTRQQHLVERIPELGLLARISTKLSAAVASGDAAFTTKPVVEAIRERGGSYFLFVKRNQPELCSELERAF